MGKITFEKNKEILKNTYSDLFKWIEKAEPVDWISHIKNYDGKDNILIKLGSKVEPNYPLDDIRKNTIALTNNLKLHKQNATILIGSGLGYTLKHILQKAEKGHITILIEPVAHMFLLTMYKVNMTKYLKEGSLIVVNPEDKTSISDIIGFIDTTSNIENWGILLEKYTQLRTQEYSEITQHTLNIINQTKCNIGTMMAAGKEIASNDIESLPYVIRHRGIAELKDLYKNKPAILVSTGPSLSKNIHIIAKFKDKAIIIAVAQALRPLLAYDIRPDFICSVDFGAVNMTHLKGIMESDVSLVALNRTYAPLLMEYRGPKFIVVSPSPGFEDTVVNIMQNRGSLNQGGSVAHLCLSFAKHLGCNPIILTGQDLAYEKNYSHIPLADSTGEIQRNEDGTLNWNVKDQRSNIYTKEKTKYSMGMTYKVAGYYGEAVDTNAGLLCFITSFENMVKDFPKNIKVINATQGGAFIKGMKNKLLIDCFSDDDSKIDKTIINPFLSLRPNYKKEIKEALIPIKKDIEILETIRKESKLGLDINKKIKELVDKKKGMWTKKEKIYISKLLQKNYKHSNKAHEAAKKNSLISITIYDASRKIAGRELNVKNRLDHVLKYKSDLLTRLKSNYLILNSAMKGAVDLKKIHNKTLKILQKYLQTKDESIFIKPINYKINFDDVKKYFNSGNFAHPLLDARKILYGTINLPIKPIDNCELISTQLREKALEIEQQALVIRNEAIKKAEEIDNEYYRKLIKYNKLIKKSRKIVEKEKNFEASLQYIKEANQLFPDKIEAQWGLATAYRHLQQYEESIKIYKELIINFPDNIRFKYELGQVQIISNNVSEGLNTIKEVVEKTKNFDQVLKHVALLYFKIQKYDEAILACTEYLKKYNTDSKTWKLLGDCYMKINEKNKANLAYDESEKLKTTTKFDKFWM